MVLDTGFPPVFLERLDENDPEARLGTPGGRGAAAGPASRLSEHVVDLHGYYLGDVDDIVPRAVQKAWKAGATTLCLIHGHGRFRRPYGLFANTNTGLLGMAVRRLLREDRSLRRWIYAKIDCSDWGSTTVRLRPNPNPSRKQ